MKKFNTLDAAAIIIWLLPAAYLFYLYPILPLSVPIHFGIDGTPDGFGDKNDLVKTIAILMITVVGIYFLLKFLPAIDPKKTASLGVTVFQKLALTVVYFMSALGIIILLAATHKGLKINNILLPAIGIMFAFIGNLMNNIKPNYFAGIRTPWTLEDPENWRVTHRLASKLWFFGGIGLTIVTLLLPAVASFVVFMSAVAVLALVPVVYSFIYFKKHQVK